MAHKPQRCSKLIGGQSSAQPRANVLDLREGVRASEQDRRLAESGRRTSKRFELSRLPRWTEAVLVELIGTQIGWWVETAAEPAEISDAQRERLKALNCRRRDLI